MICYSNFQFYGTNSKTNERISGTAVFNDLNLKVGEKDRKSTKNNKWSSSFRNDSLESEEEAKKLAIGVLQENSMKFQTAVIEAEGENRIIPGKRITVKAVGANFTGEWLVERVVHDCSNVAGGFKTRVWLRRNKTGKEACG